MLKMKKLILTLVFVLLAIPCQAKIISVDDDGPADFNNIQAAIDFAEDDDTIVVKPGTYNQNILFNGKAVTVTGKDPDNLSVVQSTIITSSSGYSVTFDFGEGSNSVLTGFTLTGQGIRCPAPRQPSQRIFSGSARAVELTGNSAPRRPF